MVIDAKAGANICSLGRLSHIPSEREYLVGRNEEIQRFFLFVQTYIYSPYNLFSLHFTIVNPLATNIKAIF